MAAKRQLLSQAEFDEIAKSEEWRIVELGLPAIHVTPGIQRKQHIFGAFGSGDLNATKALNNQDAVFGMDIFTYENRPKTERGEWLVNVYHYVVTRTGRPERPFCLHGPFTEETLVGHWPQCLDLSPYE